MECAPFDVGFDVAASAGWYSAVAGLLAGFALVALLLPLDHEATADEGDEAASAVLEFVCAFFGLVLLAFAYAVIAGRTAEERSQAVAAHEQMLFGPLFGLTTLLLLIGLYSVLGSYGRNRAVFRPARGVILVATATLGPIVVIVLQFSNTLDVGQARAQSAADEVCSGLGVRGPIAVNLAITVLTVIAILVVGIFRRRLPRWGWAGPLLAKAVLGFIVATVVWSALVVPFVDTATLSSTIVEQVSLIAVGIVALVFSIVAWSMRAEDDLSG